MKHPYDCGGHCNNCANLFCNYRGWDKLTADEKDDSIIERGNFKNGQFLSCCGPGEDPCTFICDGMSFVTSGQPTAHCGIDTKGEFIIGEDRMKTGYKRPWTFGVVRLATVNEINVLYKKMHEAGFKWSHKDKKLIKL